MDDEQEIAFEVGQKSDGKLWTVTVTCTEGLTEKEFAAAILSLANDIICGDVSFDNMPDAEAQEQH
jgi:hypothetical protein